MPGDHRLGSPGTSRQGLWFMLGPAAALFAVAAGGDLRYSGYGFPAGWAAVWHVITIGSMAIGITLLVFPFGAACLLRTGGERHWGTCASVPSIYWD